MSEAYPRPPAPPIPRQIPGLWRTLLLMRENLVSAWPREAYVGELLRRRLLGRWIVVANSPAGVRHVMVDNAENYRKSDSTRKALSAIIGDGMFISHGELWRRQRRLAAPALQPARIASFAAVMLDAGRDLLERWSALPDDAEVDVGAEMAGLAIDVICRSMFSHDLGDRARIVWDSFTVYQDVLGRFGAADLLDLRRHLPNLPNRRVARATAALDSVLNDVIARRIAEHTPRNDLLSMLLAARDAEPGKRLTDRQIRDEVAVIILAGHETTANALTWSWFLLSEFPDKRAALDEELTRVLGNRPPGFGDLDALDYTRAVFLEAMRLYPPIHTFSRHAIRDDAIGDAPVPAGSIVIVSPWLMHRHRGYWRNPEDFMPERFLPANDQGRDKHLYIPFGAGPRVCLGAHFAMAEGVLLLAAIAQRFRLRLRPGHPVMPQALLTLRPRDGMPMRLERRAPG